MVYTREFIKVIGFVLCVTLPKSCNGADNCYHPWKKDFGLQINDSIWESFKSLSTIVESFLTMTTSGKKEENMEADIKKCIMSPDCKIYTLLDKKIEKSLTLCIVAYGSETCYVSNCTCLKKARQSRDVSSRVYDTNTKDKPSSKKGSECTMMPSRNHHLMSTHRYRTGPNTAIENLTKFNNANMLITVTENIINGDVPLRDVPTWLNGLLFFIGVGVGTLFGGFSSFIAFKRKCSCSRPVFGSNKKENVDKALNDEICFNEVTEYSEIPEYTKKTDLEEKEKLLDKPDPSENENNMSNVEYLECIPMVNNDNKSESDFQWNHMDVKEHSKVSVCMEQPVDIFSNNSDIDTDDIKPKGQDIVTDYLYQAHTEPYFLLSTTRDIKDSLPDSIDCEHHDQNQEEHANCKTLPTPEDIKYQNTDEEGKEQSTENEYFLLKECS